MKKITLSEYFLFMEAWLFLALARSMLIVLPFKRIAPLLGKMKNETPEDNPIKNMAILNKIKIAVLRGSHYSPWRTKCFEQAIAAKIMFKKRSIKSTLYLGVFKDVSNVIRAHAWLKIGNIVITGGPGIERYTVISSFSS